jgi:methionyl-tRNA formyltransferase
VPVVIAAEKLALPIITTADKSELSTKIAEANFKSRVAVLIDFGIIVKQDVIDTFPFGIINSHFSLLPEWRGADPITFAILSGQHRTGISLMLLVEPLDEGPLLAQVPYDMAPAETTPSLTEALIELSYKSLCEILPLYLSGSAVPAPQEAVTIASSPEPIYSRKLTKEDGVLDFNKPAAIIEREIRAYLEWPKSHATIAGKDIVVTAAHVVATDSVNKVGTVFTLNKELLIQTGDGVLVVDSLKPAGKPEMRAAAFVAGYGRNL